jgi:hypothetical protein
MSFAYHLVINWRLFNEIAKVNIVFVLMTNIVYVSNGLKKGR